MIQDYKNRNKKGETLTETLVAILIIAICFVMLQTSVVTASKINSNTRNMNEPFNTDSNSTISCKITIKRSNSTRNYDKQCHKTQGGYYYYE